MQRFLPVMADGSGGRFWSTTPSSHVYGEKTADTKRSDETMESATNEKVANVEQKRALWGSKWVMILSPLIRAWNCLLALCVRVIWMTRRLLPAWWRLCVHYNAAGLRPEANHTFFHQ
jgi:hypothetical protein